MGGAVVGEDCDGDRDARRVKADHVDQHGAEDGEAHVELRLVYELRIVSIFLPAASAVNTNFATCSSHNLGFSLQPIPVRTPRWHIHREALNGELQVW